MTQPLCASVPLYVNGDNNSTCILELYGLQWYIIMCYLCAHLLSGQWTSWAQEHGQLCLPASISSNGMWGIGFFWVQTLVLSPSYWTESHNLSPPQMLHLLVWRKSYKELPIITGLWKGINELINMKLFVTTVIHNILLNPCLNLRRDSEAAG